MMRFINYGKPGSMRRIGDAYELQPYNDTKVVVRLSSIISIETYEKDDWEFLPKPEPSFWRDLLPISRYPKQYKGKPVYYVGYFRSTPAIKVGTSKMMRLRLVDGSKVECDFDESLIGAFGLRKEGDSK